MDYNEFSNSIKAKYPEYANIDNKELAQKMIEKYPQYKEQVTFKTEPVRPKSKGNPLTDFAQGAVQGFAELPTEIGFKLGNPVRQMFGKAPLTKEQIQQVKEEYKNLPVIGYTQKKPQSISGNIGKFAGELAPTLLLPEVKIAQAPKLVNLAATGAYQGGLIGGAESFKNQGNISGVLPGAVTGGVIAPAVPYAGKAIQKSGELVKKVALNSFPGIKENTVKQLTKPGSKALEMTEDSAQQKLLDITKKVRNDYNALLNKKGDAVGNLLKELPEDVTFEADGLKNTYDAILNNYSLSKNPELNPAINATSRELNKINDLIAYQDEKALAEALEKGVEAPKPTRTPKELYDINKNIADMINWDMPGTQTKNNVLEQIYLANAKKISDLSPALKKANKEYADLMDFQKNDGIRQILRGDLVSGENLGNAPSVLKNYKGNISSGAKRDNIQELEKILTNEGYSPFLNDIDDINAANELLKTAETGFNPFGLTDKIKLLERPILYAARRYNSSGIPASVDKGIKGLKKLRSVQKRVLPEVPVTVIGTSPLLYGGVSNTEGY